MEYEERTEKQKKELKIVKALFGAIAIGIGAGVITSFVMPDYTGQAVFVGGLGAYTFLGGWSK